MKKSLIKRACKGVRSEPCEGRVKRVKGSLRKRFLDIEAIFLYASGKENPGKVSYT
jgi:hypothetical protein